MVCLKTMFWGLMAFLATSIPLISSQSPENPVVSIDQGNLFGNNVTSRDGRPFYEFRAVPYGHIPKRFDIAELAPAWEGVRNATISSDGCIYRLYNSSFMGKEDCLDLDLSTPFLPDHPNFPGPMPVMVFIYGGAMLLGAAFPYGPKYFMDENVVLVVLNYRLGAFGLLNANIEGARGNQALKDMVLGLRWVQQNIASFGGDPTSVTIMGESTGGGSVNALIVSPMAQGLFHRAIMQSGAATCPQFFRQNEFRGLENAKLLAGALDCPTRDPEAMVDCLRNAPAEEIATLSEFALVLDEYSFKPGGIQMTPTFETFITGPNDPNVFLAEDPYILAQRGEFARVPIIIGHMFQEGLAGTLAILSDPGFVGRLNREFGRRNPGNILYYNSAPDPCSIVGKIKEFYFQGKNISLENAVDFENLSNDRLMRHCNRKTAEEFAKFTNVYMFNFTRYKPFAELPPAHGDDLHYLYDLHYPEVDIPEILPGDLNYEFSKNFLSLLVSFAKNGKPDPLWSGREWTPLAPGQPQQWLQLDDQPSMMTVDKVFMDSWNFWDSLDINQFPIVGTY